MPFGSQPEVETCRPRRRLHPLGYYVSQHVKVMDAIEAAADNPKVTASPGPTLGDFLVPALRRGSDHSGRTIPLYRSAKADPGRRFHALRDKVIAETSCGGRGCCPPFEMTTKPSLTMQTRIGHFRRCWSSWWRHHRHDDADVETCGVAVIVTVAAGCGRARTRQDADLSPARPGRRAGRG
jgi:hypothetical protein